MKNGVSIEIKDINFDERFFKRLVISLCSNPYINKHIEDLPQEISKNYSDMIINEAQSIMNHLSASEKSIIVSIKK